MPSVPSWITKIKQPAGSLLTQTEYFRCFVAALSCMARTIGAKRHLVNSVELDERVKNDDAAENYFYGWHEYRRLPSGALVLGYTLTQKFFEYSYKGLHRPLAVSPRPRESQRSFIQDCATNYILKNFWHNHVHNKLQHMTNNNYAAFGGEAVFMSDFEADNVGTILLALSYGHAIETTSSLIAQPDRKIITLLQRNRCNKVFAIRASARASARARRRQSRGQGPDGFLYEEWRNRRALAVYLGGWLLAAGRAVASLSIHADGELRRRRGQWERASRRVCVELNGARFALPSMNPEFLGDDVENNMREISTRVDEEYRRALLDNAALRLCAKTALRAKLRCLGVLRVENRVP